MRKEEYALVLDYLPQGKPTDRYKEPIAQVIGEDYFTLLEVVIKPNITLNIEQRIFVGKGKRDKVEKIKRRIKYEELTATAKSQLHSLIMKIVEKREEVFVRFFNSCGPVNIRLHQLELLPGVGKRHMEEILDEREKEPFKSFEDVKKRIPLLPNPQLLIAHRIEEEIKGLAKHYLFVKPPAHEIETYKKRR